MERTPKEIFEEKVLLVYEHNKRSPLFVRAASLEIENNNVEKAINILRSGLKIYPNYSTALFILGKALAIIGKYNEALEHFQTASNLINSNDSMIYYKSELEKIKQARTPFEIKRKTTLIKETVLQEVKYDLQETEELINQDIEKGIDKLPETKISRIAKQTSELDENSSLGIDENIIISDTFADILVSQERYDEAIYVYKELLKKYPTKNQIYLDRINTLSDKKNS